VDSKSDGKSRGKTGLGAQGCRPSLRLSGSSFSPRVESCIWVSSFVNFLWAKPPVALRSPRTTNVCPVGTAGGSVSGLGVGSAVDDNWRSFVVSVEGCPGTRAVGGGVESSSGAYLDWFGPFSVPPPCAPLFTFFLFVVETRLCHCSGLDIEVRCGGLVGAAVGFLEEGGVVGLVPLRVTS